MSTDIIKQLINNFIKQLNIHYSSNPLTKQFYNTLKTNTSLKNYY